MSNAIAINKDFYQLMGIVEPTYSALKTRRRDLEATLKEIKHYKSFVGTIRRFFGRIQEQRVLNTLTILPKITDAIAEDLQEKVQQLYELRNELYEYLGGVNGKIESILEARERQDSDGNDEDYGGLVQRMRSKKENES